VRASEIFLDKDYEEGTLERVFKKILRDKENIVLIGMPSSGKSTVGALLSRRLSRELVDTDRLIVQKDGRDITQIFSESGEDFFRDLESEAVIEASALTSRVIATGGGAILREKNIKALRENGRIYFIDRPLEALIPTSDRPLSSNRASIEKRYKERYGIYTSASDVIIYANVVPEEVSDKITEEFFK
jgi:shikimate dehydrogenase